MSTEDMDALFDHLVMNAESLNFDQNEYDRLIRILQARGFTRVTHGKNKPLEGEMDHVKISFSYNYKKERWLFQFRFDPANYSYSQLKPFINTFLKSIYTASRMSYHIYLEGSSEVTLDLKFDVIQDLQKVVPRIRRKNDLLFQFHEANTNAFIKTYQNLETKKLSRIESRGSALNWDAIDIYIHAKDKLLDDELENQIALQTILLQNIDLRNGIDNLGTWQELQIRGLQEQSTAIINNQTSIIMQIEKMHQSSLRHNLHFTNQIELFSEALVETFNSSQANTIIAIDTQSTHLIDIAAQLAQQNAILSQPGELKKDLSYLFSKIPDKPKIKETSLISKIKEILKRFYLWVKGGAASEKPATREDGIEGIYGKRNQP